MRVLVIEDYEPLRKSLVQGLREDGAVVDATGDGEEGMWYAGDEAYDVIVLDWMLPKVDGLTILRSLRAKGSRCPVLMLTAKDQVPDRVRGLDEGADDYLVKPFAFDELLARVRALVRRRFDVTQSQFTAGPLVIDLKGRVATCDGTMLNLTHMEYRVLEILAMRAGQIVSRSDISDHVYGFDGEPNSNAIDVYIAQVRKKLDAAGADGLIRTHRGMGYQLAMEA